MFERYTEKARRLIFFARYEASQFGSPYIETEHLLLGLLREDKALTNRFLSSHASMDAIRKQIEGHSRIREKVSTSVDLPLSNESKRVLAYAAEEAERLAHHHIGTEHLLLGMLREEKCFAAEILHERGLRLSSVREELARVQASPAVTSPQDGRSLLTSFARDLTQSAIDNKLAPMIGRTDELRSVLHILSGRHRNSVVLLGDAGVGKTAIVEALAQQIADGEAPPFLTEKRLLEFDLSRMAAGCTRAQFAERMYTVVREAAQLRDPILFFRELTTLAGLGLGGWLDAVNILRPALSRGEMQCITEATAADYEATLQTIPWFATCTRTVSVSPLSEQETLQVLHSQKVQYENFHTVSYSNAAVERAARHANGYPARGIDLLDIAGTIVKLREAYPPFEIMETHKKIRFILERMEAAIANHEFEKGRFYSDEERKERENLRVLQEKHRLDDPPTGREVRLEDMEAAILRVTN